MIKPKLNLESPISELLPWEGVRAIDLKDPSEYVDALEKLRKQQKKEALQRDLEDLRKKVTQEKNKRIKRETKFQRDLNNSARKASPRRFESKFSPWGVEETTSSDSIKLHRALARSRRKELLADKPRTIPKKRTKRIRKELPLVVSATAGEDRLKYAEQIAASKKQPARW